MKPQFRVQLTGGRNAELGVQVLIEDDGNYISHGDAGSHIASGAEVLLMAKAQPAGIARAKNKSEPGPAVFMADLSAKHFVRGRYEVRAVLHVDEGAESGVETSPPAAFYRAVDAAGKDVAVPIDDRFVRSVGEIIRLRKGMGASHLWTEYDFAGTIRPDKNDPSAYPDVELYPHGRFYDESAQAPAPAREMKFLARYEGGEAFKVLSIVYEAPNADAGGAAYQCLLVRDVEGREGYLWSVYADELYVEGAPADAFVAKPAGETPTPSVEPSPPEPSRVLLVARGDVYRLKDGLGASHLWKGYNFEKARRADVNVDAALYPNGRWEEAERLAPKPGRGPDYGALKRYSSGGSFEVLSIPFEAMSGAPDRKSYQCLFVRDGEGREGYLWSVYSGVVYVEPIPEEKPRVLVESPVLTLSPNRNYRMKNGLGPSRIWSDYDFGKTRKTAADGEDAFPDADFYPHGRWVEPDETAPLPPRARSGAVVARYSGGESIQVQYVAFEAVSAGNSKTAYQCIRIKDAEGHEGFVWSVYGGTVYIEEISEVDAAPTPPREPTRTLKKFLSEAEQRIFTGAELSRDRIAFSPDAETWTRVRDWQKSLYRKGLLAHHGISENATVDRKPFRWNDEDWQNLWQLESVVEFYLNYNDPNRPAPLVEGENKPRSPGHADYVSVDLAAAPVKSDRETSSPFRGCHLVVVDSPGGRVGGEKASLGQDRRFLKVRMSDLLERTNEGFDTVYVNPTNENSAGSRVFGIRGRKGDVLELDRPVPEEFGEGPYEWNIPAGLGSARLPSFEYNLRETTNGFDHYDAVVYVVKDGIVHARERASSFTSRSHPAGDHRGRDMSLRGNRMYYFQSDPAAGNTTINYAFTLTPGGGYTWPRVEARSYFAEPIKEGVTWNLFLHYGYYISNRTGSAGCFTSPVFPRIRDKVIELYQEDYRRAHGAPDEEAARIYGRDQTRSRELFLEEKNINRYYWSMKAWGNFWVVRPEERPVG